MPSPEMSTEAERGLAADVASPAHARSLVRQMLTLWDVDRECEVAELLTSQLVTNAVRHAATEIMLRVELADDRVRVEVRDTTSMMPRIRETPDIGGYGLRIVDEPRSRWGVDSIPDDGKTVWFEIDVSREA